MLLLALLGESRSNCGSHVKVNYYNILGFMLDTQLARWAERAAAM